jgi:anti-sigma B factor antagonist
VTPDRSSPPIPDTPGLRWEVAPAGDRKLVAARGEVDLASSPRFDEVIRAELAQGPILLDLRGITFMDSTGVRAIDGILRDADREQWSLTIGSELPRAVKQLFDITGLTATIPFADLPDTTQSE